MSDFHQMLTEIWTDYREGRVDYDTVNLHEYFNKWKVGYFAKKLLAETLLRRRAPTTEESELLRIHITTLQTDQHKLAGRRGGEVSEEGREALAEAERERAALEWTEESAIAFLKKRGKYRVTKKVTAYVYV